MTAPPRLRIRATGGQDFPRHQFLVQLVSRDDETQIPWAKAVFEGHECDGSALLSQITWWPNDAGLWIAVTGWSVGDRGRPCLGKLRCGTRRNTMVITLRSPIFLIAPMDLFPLESLTHTCRSYSTLFPGFFVDSLLGYRFLISSGECFPSTETVEFVKSLPVFRKVVEVALNPIVCKEGPHDPLGLWLNEFRFCPDFWVFRAKWKHDRGCFPQWSHS